MLTVTIRVSLWESDAYMMKVALQASERTRTLECIVDNILVFSDRLGVIVKGMPVDVDGLTDAAATWGGRTEHRAQSAMFDGLTLHVPPGKIRDSHQQICARQGHVCVMPRIKYTADILVFHLGDELELLTITRGKPPFQGCLALPGGFVERDESPILAAQRELQEETNVIGLPLVELGVWDTPGRDPRGLVSTTAFMALAPDQSCQAGDDAATAQYQALSQVAASSWSFDHRDIVTAALRRLATGDTSATCSALDPTGDAVRIQCLVEAAAAALSWFQGEGLGGVFVPRRSALPIVQAAHAAGFADGRLLDCGTGSGCIALALLRRLPQTVTAVAIDADPNADLNLADRCEVRALRFSELQHLDVAEPQRFSIAVSNPPYLPKRLMEHVGFARELQSQSDGLGAYEELAQNLPQATTSGRYNVHIRTKTSEIAALVATFQSLELGTWCQKIFTGTAYTALFGHRPVTATTSGRYNVHIRAKTSEIAEGCCRGCDRSRSRNRSGAVMA
eukprot:s129_g14.t3